MTQRSLTLLFTAAVAAASSAPASGRQESPSPCVALILPSVQGAEGSATDVASGIRDLFTSFLNGPTIRAIPLDARLASQALDEASHKGCAHVLVANVTMRRGRSSIGRAIGQGVGAAAWYAPLPAGAVAGAVVRSAAAGGAQAVSTLAASTRARDEMQIEYRLVTAGTLNRATPHIEKARAHADREDLLTTLVERASAAIAAVVAAP
jgi:hypothetical protein